MKKRFFSMLLALIMALGLFPASAAASSIDEALGEIDIYNGGTKMSYLSINGKIQSQIYTYYNFDNGSGQVREIPAYCVNPNQYGVPQTVEVGESIEYLADEKASDPKVLGIVANGYPTRSLQELGLENKYLGYYATKMALWCYLISDWDINNLKVNPNLSGVELTRAQKVLAAAKDIYARGTAWNEALSPEITCTPDRDTAYLVTVDGKQYKQQIFTFWSKTWVCDYDVKVAFTNPDDVPEGTRIVNMSNQDITSITTESTGDGYAGKFKVLYPLESVQGNTGSVQLSFSTNVYKYAVFFAVCQEKDQYGNLQNYVVDTDPTTSMKLSAYSNYEDSEIDTPDTGLRILKYETGTEIPISGALFEVIGPDGDSIGTFATNGDGRIEIPLSKVGNYTVIERQAPSHYIISEEPAQNVTVVYDEVAEVTFFNDPYGTLRIEKKSDTGMNLPGAVIKIEHIESGQTWTATTTSAGVAIFDEIPLGAYRIQEITAPAGWKLDDTVYTATVVAGETTTIPIINEELPGLRIIKYDRKNMVAMPNVTFAVYRDGEFLGNFKTDQFGEILLTNVEPGTYRAFEVDTGDEGHILDTTPQEVELHAGDGIKELLFFNDVKPGLRLVKVDSDDPSKVIPNAVFEIKSVEGTYGPQEFWTDENGEIDLSMLPPGSYVVTEKSCDGYVIDEAQRIIELKPNEDAQFVFTNHIKPSLQLIKLSSDGSRLAGVTFRIAKIEDGSHYLDRTTNSNGEILISDLEPGVYSVRELSSVLDHIPDDTEHHVELFPGQTSTITLEELSSDGSHVIDTPPQTVYLSGEDQEVVQVYFGNSPKGSLLIKKVSSADNSPISDVQFFVTESDGTVVGDSNGYFTTDSAGTILIEGIDPGTTLVVKETRAKDGFLLDNTPQTAQIKAGQTVTLEFRNQPTGQLIIHKLSGDDKKTPLEGVQFKITYSDGSFVDADSGQLSSNGLYWTNSEGQIILSGLTGTVVVTEVESVPGYTIDPNTQSQTVVINPNDTQELYFYNNPIGGIEVIKVNASKTSERIPDTTFEIRRMDDALVDTITTDKNGRAYLPLEDGSYYAIEVEANPDFVLDDTPHYFEVKNGEVTTLRIKNEANSGILIHKVDTSGEGIYGVKFLLYDEDRNPIGEFTSDDNGYVYITSDDLPDGANTSGRFYLRELEAAEGYILDEEYKTVYVRPGRTAEIEWVNEAITGQIQIYKYASEANPVTGDPAGTPLQGAVYEIIHERSGRVVDYITTNARGVAASKPLPLMRYKIREVTAPAYYQLDPTVHDVTLEYAGQIIKIAAYDKPANLKVTVTKTGNKQLLAGDSMRYDLTVANNSNVALENFYLHDQFPTDCSTAKTITTGTYNTRLNYQITYKTNYNDYRVLATNLLSTNNYAFDLSAVQLMQGEVVTDVRLEFGKVPAGFASVVKPTVTVQTSASLANGYQVVNRVDAGGQYMSQWETGRAAWITLIVRLNEPTLPKTGY